MLDHLWNGWRAEYIQSATSGGSSGPSADGRSVFTRLLESGLDDVELHIVGRSARCFAILNAFPYAPGHVLVLPIRQVAALEDLDDDERMEIWALVADAVRAVKTAYAPDGLNVGINLGAAAGGSVSEHLHVHVVPRWAGDTNFMTSLASTRTIPEALDRTAARLRDAWPSAAP